LDNIDWIREKLFRKYNIRSDKKIILNVWSEESRKNIITILKLMEKIDDYVFIKLWRPIVAQNRENHLKYIQEHKLENNVYLLDFIEDMHDFVWFYNIADVFLFPSLFEWFWRPPIEAQACWCPVISSKEWALWEVLWDSAIILDNPENVDEIFGKLKLVDKVKNEKIKLWFENIQRFSLDNNVKKWEKII
jgi:glycosyltransferase involved in cell wall biosynthesis